MLIVAIELSIAKIGSLIILGLVFETIALGGALSFKLSMGESVSIGSRSHLSTPLFPNSPFSLLSN
jgi:hypothetical protein